MGRKKGKRKRKSPVRHSVKSHVRKGKSVDTYNRGHRNKKPKVVTKIIKTHFTADDLDAFWSQDEDYVQLPYEKARFLEENTEIGPLFDWKETDKAEEYAERYAEKHGFPFVYQAASGDADHYCVLFSKVRIPGVDEQIWLSKE